MIEEQGYEQLRNEIQRLRDEQQRLRDEQEKLRRDASPNGGSSGQKSQADRASDGDKPASGDARNKGDQKSGKPGEDKAEGKGENEGDKTAGEKSEENKEDAHKPPVVQRVRTYVQMHPKGVLLGAIGFVVAVILAVILIIYLSSYESTDDAQVDGHLNAIGARIAGTVTGIYIENNQAVDAGQLCVSLDPADYQNALDQAKASYLQAEAQLRAENPNVPIIETSILSTISSSGADVAAAEATVLAAQQDYQAKLASVRQAEANNNKAQTDVIRYRALVAREEISHEQFDTVIAAAKSQAAMVEAAQASASASQKAIDGTRAQLLQARSKLEEANKNGPRSVAVRRAQLAGREAALLSAQAQMGQAALNLSYAKIFAPVTGIISEKTVEIGQRISAGEQMFSISQTQDIWITANFKETQLRKMHSGLRVDIQVDAYDRKFHGYVEDMPGSTGSIASLLPPENATGNFVKVVQRLPVRIRLNAGEDPDHILRLGMSVEPKVWLR